MLPRYRLSGGEESYANLFNFIEDDLRKLMVFTILKTMIKRGGFLKNLNRKVINQNFWEHIFLEGLQK